MQERFFELMAALTEAGDAFIEYTDRDGVVHILIDDFEGFDAEWNEIERFFEAPDLVTELFDLLGNADSYTVGMYPVYRFSDFAVRVGYTSYDI